MEPATAQPIGKYSHFVTFTLKPELYGKTCRQQLRSTFKKACFELERVCKSYQLVAELTKKCNIHYHALVEFDETEFFTKNDLSLILHDNIKPSNVFGRFDCEPIKNYEATSAYLVKEIVKTGQILNPRGKTQLDYQKEWQKGMIAITDVKVTRLKDYLIIDDGIQDDIDYNEEIQNAIKLNLSNLKNKNV